jgi:hypothetical protein
LNRLELSKLEPTRYHKISHNPIAIKRLLVDLFVEAHELAPSKIILDLDATDDPVHGNQRHTHGDPRRTASGMTAAASAAGSVGLSRASRLRAELHGIAPKIGMKLPPHAAPGYSLSSQRGPGFRRLNLHSSGSILPHRKETGTAEADDLEHLHDPEQSGVAGHRRGP